MRTRLIAFHRAGGYLLVILLCIMAYCMNQRLAGLGITGHLPTHLVLHIALVLVLVPLLLLKNIDRTPLQAQPFVAEGIRNNHFAVRVGRLPISFTADTTSQPNFES
jgi:hypothetical protein